MVEKSTQWELWLQWNVMTDPTIHAVVRAYQPTFFTNPQGPEPLKLEVLQQMVMELFKSKEASYKALLEFHQTHMFTNTCGACFDYDGVKCCAPQPGDRETMRRPESTPCKRGVRRT